MTLRVFECAIDMFPIEVVQHVFPPYDIRMLTIVSTLRVNQFVKFRICKSTGFPIFIVKLISHSIGWHNLSVVQTKYYELK